MNEEQSYWATPRTQHVHVSSDTLRPSSDLIECFRHYARERPEVVALWCFGIGFVLGWKLKPW